MQSELLTRNHHAGKESLRAELLECNVGWDQHNSDHATRMLVSCLDDERSNRKSLSSGRHLQISHRNGPVEFRAFKVEPRLYIARLAFLHNVDVAQVAAIEICQDVDDKARE